MSTQQIAIFGDKLVVQRELLCWKLRDLVELPDSGEIVNVIRKYRIFIIVVYLMRIKI